MDQTLVLWLDKVQVRGRGGKRELGGGKIGRAGEVMAPGKALKVYLFNM